MKPLPRVSAKHYAPQPARSAKVIWKIKGSGTEGTLYEGQRIVRECRTCGGAKTRNP
jgi:hypothetical protein